MQPVAHKAYEQGLALSAQSRHADAIGAYERALAEKPDDIRVLFALGNTASSLGMPRAAEEFFRRVLALEPDRLEALVNLANVLRAQGQLDAAKRLIEPALERAPDAPDLLLTLGSVHREMGDRVQAKAFYREALNRDANHAAAQGNLADLLADDGDIAEAMALYDRAVLREPKNAQLKLNRAILHLLRGELKDGWRDYAARLKIPGKAPICDHGLKPWNGAHLKRTRLLVTVEQGVGDQIMFASLVPELAARAQDDRGAILLECDPRLVSLFARSFPRVSVHPAQMQSKAGMTTAHYGWLKQAGGANAAIEMGSLPRTMRNSVKQFPAAHAFLAADPDEAGRWRSAFALAGPPPYVGICWRSGKVGGLRNLQFAPLAAWAEFIRNAPGTIVSVQYDAMPEETDGLSSLSGRDVFVPPALDQKNELDRACAMLSALDHVVSAPTAVSWLSSAAGVPTSKVLHDTSWTSFGQPYEPFAPACACLSPKVVGDWSDVFAQATVRLTARTTIS
ncbi:MAG: tetratricopeptide repeat protein [Rhizomicrobium sp.]|jgi:Tfp pilus assembly protein PilF